MEMINGPESHYSGPMSGLGAAHDSWKAAVDKINANFKKIAAELGIPIGTSAPAASAEEVAQLRADLDAVNQRCAALETAFTGFMTAAEVADVTVGQGGNPNLPQADLPPPNTPPPAMLSGAAGGGVAAGQPQADPQSEPEVTVTEQPAGND